MADDSKLPNFESLHLTKRPSPSQSKLAKLITGDVRLGGYSDNCWPSALALAVRISQQASSWCLARVLDLFAHHWEIGATLAYPFFTSAFHCGLKGMWSNLDFVVFLTILS